MKSLRITVIVDWVGVKTPVSILQAVWKPEALDVSLVVANVAVDETSSQTPSNHSRAISA